MDQYRRAKRILHARELPRSRFALRLVALFMVAAVTFLGTGAFLFYHDLQSAIKVGPNKQLRALTAPADSFDNRAVNILILGSDVRAGNKSAAEQDIDGMRSDTMMLMHISRDRSRAQVVSIPRDTMLQIPDCTRTDGSVVGGRFGQVNSAFGLAAGEDDVAAGISCAIKTVESNTGIDIDEFVIADFGGFQKMVDALGGINIYLPEPIQDERSDLDLAAGCIHLNGQQALGFARVRHIGDGSDLGRIQRQQRLVSLLLRTALSKNMFTDVRSLYGFGRNALGSLTVSQNLGSLTRASGLAYSLRKINPENIIMLTAPSAPAPFDPNRVVFTDEAEAVWQSFIEDKPLPTGIKGRTAKGTEIVTPDPNAKTAPKPGTGSGNTNAGNSSNKGGGNQGSEGADSNSAGSATTNPPDDTTSNTPGSGLSKDAQLAEAQKRCEP